MEIYTIGVYNSSEEDFFRKLVENKIDTFIDVRQRRGVRGSKYTFVNSAKLQQKLSQLNIKYIHQLDLAPSNIVRDLQKEADSQKKELKQKRTELDVGFKSLFKKIILDQFDIKRFVQQLELNDSHKVVLFCVEEIATACHRSLIAERLNSDFNFDIYNL